MISSPRGGVRVPSEDGTLRSLEVGRPDPGLVVIRPSSQHSCPRETGNRLRFQPTRTLAPGTEDHTRTMDLVTDRDQGLSSGGRVVSVHPSSVRRSPGREGTLLDPRGFGSGGVDVPSRSSLSHRGSGPPNSGGVGRRKRVHSPTCLLRIQSGFIPLPQTLPPRSDLPTPVQPVTSLRSRTVGSRGRSSLGRGFREDEF